MLSLIIYSTSQSKKHLYSRWMVAFSPVAIPGNWQSHNKTERNTLLPCTTCTCEIFSVYAHLLYQATLGFRLLTVFICQMLVFQYVDEHLKERGSSLHLVEQAKLYLDRVPCMETTSCTCDSRLIDDSLHRSLVRRICRRKPYNISQSPKLSQSKLSQYNTVRPRLYTGTVCTLR